MVRLSFIVPFYNVEPYIEECIRSLYNQDVPREEYEVICIDDCSPDNSRGIVKRLQQDYPTLRLICHTDNKRQGGARNTGMRVAQGRFIWFVDSDDYIMPHCLGRLLEIAEREELDILDFDFAADLNKQHYVKNLESYEIGPCPAADYVFSQRQGRWSWRCSSVCGSVIHRDLLKNMHFRENVQFEDNDFAFSMYAHAAKLHHIQMKPYYYRVVENSTVHKQISFTQIRYNIELLYAYLEMIDDIKQCDVRWQRGLEELIRYVSHQVLLQLDDVRSSERVQFYRAHMGRIQSLRPFVGKKVWFALNNNLLRKLFIS